MIERFAHILTRKPAFVALLALALLVPAAIAYLALCALCAAAALYSGRSAGAVKWKRIARKSKLET